MAHVPRTSARCPGTRGNVRANTALSREPTMESVLGLPTDQPYMCFTCGRKGHKSNERLVKAVMDQCGKRILIDPATGQVSIVDRQPMAPLFKQRHDKEWLPFLRGANPLRRQIMTIRDLKTLMESYNEPSYEAPRTPYQRPHNTSWQRT